MPGRPCAAANSWNVIGRCRSTDRAEGAATGVGSGAARPAGTASAARPATPGSTSGAAPGAGAIPGATPRCRVASSWVTTPPAPPAIAPITPDSNAFHQLIGRPVITSWITDCGDSWNGPSMSAVLATRAVRLPASEKSPARFVAAMSITLAANVLPACLAAVWRSTPRSTRSEKVPEASARDSRTTGAARPSTLASHAGARRAVTAPAVA